MSAIPFLCIWVFVGLAFVVACGYAILLRDGEDPDRPCELSASLAFAIELCWPVGAWLLYETLRDVHPGAAGAARSGSMKAWRVELVGPPDDLGAR